MRHIFSWAHILPNFQRIPILHFNIVRQTEVITAQHIKPESPKNPKHQLSLTNEANNNELFE